MRIEPLRNMLIKFVRCTKSIQQKIRCVIFEHLSLSLSLSSAKKSVFMTDWTLGKDALNGSEVITKNILVQHITLIVSLFSRFCCLFDIQFKNKSLALNLNQTIQILKCV